MLCPKCKGSEFILQTTVIMVRKYKIHRDGRPILQRPLNIDEHFDNGAEFDNTVICKDCNTEYAIEGMGYIDMMEESNYNDIDLEKYGIEYIK